MGLLLKKLWIWNPKIFPRNRDAHNPANTPVKGPGHQPTFQTYKKTIKSNKPSNCLVELRRCQRGYYTIVALLTKSPQTTPQ